ncbi:hypothetical protein [Nostoc sp.]
MSPVLVLDPIVTLISVVAVSVIAPSWMLPEHFTFIAILGTGLVVTIPLAIALQKAD